MADKKYIICHFVCKNRSSSGTGGKRFCGIGNKKREFEVMRKLCNTLLSALSYVLGVFGWVYIGVWKILTKPVKYVVLAQLAGELSARGILGAFVQGFLYLSLAGGVWCIGYILRDYFKEK